MKVGKCERCGESFEDRSPAQNRRFCCDRCRKCAAEHRARKTCSTCGQLMGIRSAWNNGLRGTPSQCRSCAVASEQKRVSERGHQIERWWAEGLDQAEIGERLGWTANHVQVEINGLRAKGFGIPYRYSQARRERSAEIFRQLREVA